MCFWWVGVGEIEVFVSRFVVEMNGIVVFKKKCYWGGLWLLEYIVLFVLLEFMNIFCGVVVVNNCCVFLIIYCEVGFCFILMNFIWVFVVMGLWFWVDFLSFNLSFVIVLVKVYDGSFF